MKERRDLQTIIQWIHNSISSSSLHLPPSRISCNLTVCQATHVFGEANQSANWLAKEWLQGELEILDSDPLPYKLPVLDVDEAIGHTFSYDIILEILPIIFT